ncbi:hypothetical protein FJ444_04040 [Aestuariibacter sp. GS-14]|uniref:hypothetical protein n=1 Tax=Aestuariibacter sp. GS-14 TaxID=2590670 RepID=UPI001129D0FE|nr:hypothetical protein [Aestuariibacter sp. GS-14]TPV60803.1 hypothetical protein FJ444_04040 [Aestuariibacter sp. GS-14]
MNKLQHFTKQWFAENLSVIIMMLAVFFATHYFFDQQQQALSDVIRQFEILKLKLSLTME